MATDRFGIGSTARRPISYPDPTGDTAATRVDRERRAHLGLNPDAALHAADKYLIPIEYTLAEEAKTAYMRNEHGQRIGVLPWLDPAWTRKRRARPLRNGEVADMLAALAPRLAA